MTARRLAGPAAIVAAFVVAAMLALLAADVVRSQQALERGDARFGAVAGTEGMWSAETLLPRRASRALLGIDDDLDFRLAVQRFRLARPRSPVTQFSQLTARSGAERALARAARGGQDPRRRAVLANLRGALALEEARLSQGQGGPPLRRAIGHFRDAAMLDPGNQDAKFNLELALRLLSSSGGGSGGGGERAATPASGAGSATAGSGY